MRIRRFILLIISLVIVMIAANGIYDWATIHPSPQVAPRLSQANLSKVIDIESILLSFSEDGRPLGVLEITNNAGENVTIIWIHTKAIHAAYVDGISMATDASANTTLNLSLKPGESVSTRIALSDHSLGQGLEQINVELTINIKEIQDPLIIQSSFDNFSPRGPPG